MLVRLKRDLFLGDHHFKANRSVEIPAMIGNKSVVMYADKGDTPGEFWVLPKDALRLDKPFEKAPKPVEPQALSDFSKTPTKGFADAMKLNEDDD